MACNWVLAQVERLDVRGELKESAGRLPVRDVADLKCLVSIHPRDRVVSGTGTTGTWQRAFGSTKVSLEPYVPCL